VIANVSIYLSYSKILCIPTGLLGICKPSLYKLNHQHMLTHQLLTYRGHKGPPYLMVTKIGDHF